MKTVAFVFMFAVSLFFVVFIFYDFYVFYVFYENWHKI